MEDDSLKTKISKNSLLRILAFQQDFSNKPNLIQSAPPFSSLCYHYYNVFCYCTYHLFLFPFKFAIRENSFRLESNRVQKVLCALINILMIITSVLNFRLNIPKTKIRDNPAMLYNLTYLVAEIFYIMVFTYIGFYKQDSFHKILKISLGCRQETQVNSGRVKETYVAAALYALIVIASMFQWLSRAFLAEDKTISSLVKNSFADMMYVLFLQNTKEVNDGNNMNVLSTILAWSYIVLTFVVSFVGSLVELLFYLASFSVWKIISEFTQGSLEQIHSKGTDQIIMKFDKMKHLLSAVNCATGACVLVVFVDLVPYFSNRIIDFIDGAKWFERLDYFHYVVLIIVSLIYAAEANKKMEDYKELLFKSARNNAESDSKLYNLLLEMSTTSYGLKGCGFFTITYGFLGSVLSLFITYTIFMLQFRSVSI